MAPVHFLETSALHCGDNLEILGALPDECIDLVYLDPPFFSNRYYEVIWGDEAEVRSFEDRWEGGIQVYVNWMEKRLRQLQRVLNPTGSIYLHCDTHASHYLKVLLDEVFGASNFRNEIIWKRTTSHSSAKRFGPVHDVLFYYSKSKVATWNQPRQEYEQAYLDKYYKFDDGDGRLYWRSDLTGAGTRNGPTGQPWKGVDPTDINRHWMVPPDQLDKLDEEGRIYWPPRGKMPQYKRYREELKGKTVDDVWTDIDRINPVGNERLGYPTQKPEALLRRIIEASSNRGDVVLDPFCGCGTTIAAAEQLGRAWIGIDISPTAVRLMNRRVKKLGADTKTHGLAATEAELRQLKPFEFQNWVIHEVNGTFSPRKSGDMGIDGYSFLYNEPIQVKQSDRIGRNVVDNFETAVRRADNDTGYIVAFSFGRGAYEEAARAKAKAGLNIILVTVRDLLSATEALTRPTPDLVTGPLELPWAKSESMGSESRVPDLMSLLSAHRQPVGERPLPGGRSKSALPAAAELVESDRTSAMA